MNARRHKAMRQAAYKAGPPFPWTPVKRIVDYHRMLVNRGRPPAPITQIGRIDTVRLIFSPEIPSP